MKYIYEVIEEKHKYPLFEYCNGLRLLTYKRIDNTTPHCFQQPKSNFQTSINRSIPNLARTNSWKGNTIYKELLVVKKLEATDISAMEHLTGQAILSTRRRRDRRNNNTSIESAEKCSLCREKTSEPHIFTTFKRIQEIKKKDSFFFWSRSSPHHGKRRRKRTERGENIAFKAKKILIYRTKN